MSTAIANDRLATGLASTRAPHLHEARRRGQAAVDPRRARQPGDAVHHPAAAEPTLRRRHLPTIDRRTTPADAVPATTSPATCCSSTAWTPATAGCCTTPPASRCWPGTSTSASRRRHRVGERAPVPHAIRRAASADRAVAHGRRLARRADRGLRLRRRRQTELRDCRPGQPGRRAATNLSARPSAHYDPSGLVDVERVDFEGRSRRSRARWSADVDGGRVDWDVADRSQPCSSAETFRQITEHDALGRVTTLYNWHRDIARAQPDCSDRVAVY